MADPHDLDPEEYAHWRAQGYPHTLLDVRRGDELLEATVEDAVHIPERLIEERSKEIPRDKPVVVMDHRGECSERVSAFLITDGFQDVYCLMGGIDQYAVVVDPSIRRYE